MNLHIITLYYHTMASVVAASSSMDLSLRLDNNIEKLVENFRGLTSSSRIKDRSQTTRQTLQSSVYATTLVQASETLLKLVAELKLSLTLNDFEGINQQVDATCEALKEKCDDAENSISHLSSDVATALFELESHYYQSKWRSTDDNNIKQKSSTEAEFL